MSEMEDRSKGKANELKGEVKEGAGRVTGDPGLRAEGERDQAKGQAQGFMGKVKSWFARR